MVRIVAVKFLLEIDKEKWFIVEVKVEIKKSKAGYDQGCG